MRKVLSKFSKNARNSLLSELCFLGFGEMFSYVAELDAKYSIGIQIGIRNRSTSYLLKGLMQIECRVANLQASYYEKYYIFYVKSFITTQSIKQKRYQGFRFIVSYTEHRTSISPICATATSYKGSISHSRLAVSPAHSCPNQ